MKSTLAALTMMAAMGESMMHGGPSNKVDVQPDSESEKKDKDEAYRAVLKKKGVKEFRIRGVIIMARTEDKAYEKYEKKYGK